MAAWQVVSTSPEQTLALGAMLGEVVTEGAVVLLRGELGAGKTCFAQGVARGLGVPDAMPVTSPTFVIMNAYPGRIPLFHFDLYRLAGPEDLETVEAEEHLGREGVCLVEWPEQGGVEVSALAVSLQASSAHDRTLQVTASDPFHRALLARWKEAWETRPATMR